MDPSRLRAHNRKCSPETKAVHGAPLPRHHDASGWCGGGGFQDQGAPIAGAGGGLGPGGGAVNRQGRGLAGWGRECRVGLGAAS